MTDETANLVVEHLRRLRDEIATMTESVRTGFAKMDDRLERIERKLDLAPAR